MKNWLLIQPKVVLKNLYPRAIWNFDGVENCIYLTFDDGPIEGLTDWVIDELSKYNAKATFFCVGANIIKNYAIFERVKANGHKVANHTMFHSNGLKTDLAAYLQEVDSCEAYTQNKLFRPPYGQIKRSQYKALINKGYKIIFWDVVSYDYEKIAPQIVLKKVLKYTKPGSIILFHDNIKAEENLKYALPLFLRHFSQLGYVFKTLPS
jgi:peptidoglycan/xylan/chitin deacetylase (PgdA/CDA1 family)